MIYLFPELSALYHRILLVSASPSSLPTFFDEWSRNVWPLSEPKTSYSAIDKTADGILHGWVSLSLGRRNQDQQRLVSYGCSLDQFTQAPYVTDLCDSLIFEVDPGDESSEQFFRLQNKVLHGPKKVVLAFKKEFHKPLSLHERALDKKLLEIAPESLRILWPNKPFLQDALEWVLSF